MDATAYLRASARTASGQFHTDKVNPAEMDFMLQAVIAAGQWADRIKRSLYYGADKVDNSSARWCSTSLNLKPELADLIHATLGGITEAAEIAEHVRDVLAGKVPLDAVNLKEEFGDTLWYIALGLRFLGIGFEETFATNIAKLQARFPDKFTKDAALNRDLAAERATLMGQPVISSGHGRVVVEQPGEPEGGIA
jgi:NTP pyrophosphatase (non-canonical NTP hydrolase)